MFDPAVLTVAAFLHIISAIGWLGASIYFAFILGPGLSKLSPPTQTEFFSKLGLKSIRYFQGTSTATVIFGLFLVYVFTNGNPSSLTSSVLGQRLLVGIVLGLVAYLDAILVTGREFTKAYKLITEMKGPPQGPPTEIMAAMKKGGMGALIGTLILIVTAAFMVMSGFPF